MYLFLALYEFAHLVGMLLIPDQMCIPESITIESNRIYKQFFRTKFDLTIFTVICITNSVLYSTMIYHNIGLLILSFLQFIVVIIISSLYSDYSSLYI